MYRSSSSYNTYYHHTPYYHSSYSSSSTSPTVNYAAGIFVGIYFVCVFGLLFGFIIYGIYRCIKRGRENAAHEAASEDFERAYQSGRGGFVQPVVVMPRMAGVPSQPAYYNAPPVPQASSYATPPPYSPSNNLNVSSPFGKR